ncbi:MAG: hypothetical protein HYX76_03580 [Acidobacteria bacterium]|nr:hypothetical protein [Acidobacteriota bacterium]
MGSENLIVNNDVVVLLPEDLCRRHKVVPLDRIKNSLLVAMVNPDDVWALDDIKFVTGLDVEPGAAPESSILEAIEAHYHGAAVGPAPAVEPAVDDFTYGKMTPLRSEEQEDAERGRQIVLQRALGRVRQDRGPAMIPSRRMSGGVQ